MELVGTPSIVGGLKIIEMFTEKFDQKKDRYLRGRRRFEDCFRNGNTRWYDLLALGT